jgi:hypothetical protein
LRESRQNSQPARVGNSCGELCAGDPLHSPLDDWILNARQFREGCIQGSSRISGLHGFITLNLTLVQLFAEME